MKSDRRGPHAKYRHHRVSSLRELNCLRWLPRYNHRFMIVARRFLIGGRVQGVGFRMFAAARAAAEGVHGYIQNLPDGRIEALVEGDEEAVDRIELALRRGPSHAHVESVSVESVQPTHRATGFSTR
jgi:acylphosphatase